MAKTAEEILKETLTKKAVELNDPVEDDEWDDWKEEQGPEFMQVLDESHKAFAAQEVEAYRLKIRAKVFDMYTSTGDIEGLEVVGHEAAVASIIKLIDAVK